MRVSLGRFQRVRQHLDHIVHEVALFGKVVDSGPGLEETDTQILFGLPQRDLCLALASYAFDWLLFIIAVLELQIDILFIAVVVVVVCILANRCVSWVHTLHARSYFVPG